ncbi:uncharacterized protein LOC115826659 [Chanos chanos]|uniref:Uncharacterized protein LOC115826659 n=1 Tax=Chanos chanos TaxID=29144 RepID=A0A6J2WRH4_CHACN|nr:uncharacterized protein LOC115826659 [Chanos chanos]
MALATPSNVAQSNLSACKDDTNLRAKWEVYLSPAPLSIAVLGELVYVSSSDDFSINKNPPKDGFKFIRYPESFRACLMQVCNAGWRAFNEAHKNMDQIRLYTLQVPEHIKTCMELTVQDDDELVQEFLPDELRQIDHIVTECSQLATSTESKFDNVIKLIGELLEACVNAKQGHDAELEDVKKQMEEAKLKEQSAREASKRADEAFKKMDERLAEAEKSYKESIDKLPNGWELFGMQLVNSISEASISVASGIAQMMLVINNFRHIPTGTTTAGTTPSTDSKVIAVSAETAEPAKDDTTTELLASINILSQSHTLLLLCGKLKEFLDADQIQWSKVYDQKSSSVKSDFLRKIFAEIKDKTVKEQECQSKVDALKICDKGIDICTNMAKYAPEGKTEDAKIKELVKDINDLNDSALAFDYNNKIFSNRPDSAVSPPHFSQIQKNSEGDGPVGRYIATAQFNVEQRKAEVSRLTQMYEKSLENMEKKKQELTDILIMIQNLGTKEIDFNTKIKILIKGLEAMGRVKEQWQKTACFFQMVSNIVKTTLSTTMAAFKLTVEKATSKGKTYTKSKYVKDKIYLRAVTASNCTNLVSMISTTYTQVSEEYLMPCISTLGRLMTMDPNGNSFRTDYENLQQSCQKAEEGLINLARKNKVDFESQCQAAATELKEIMEEKRAVQSGDTVEKM